MAHMELPEVIEQIRRKQSGSRVLVFSVMSTSVLFLEANVTSDKKYSARQKPQNYVTYRQCAICLPIGPFSDMV